ncbi:hypothetical protein GCM10010246_01200 [Streptomyces cuspidosporus]|uniref:Cobalamin biosynthesis protein CobW n=1 Tax=Streptomyces cuspidosporus TaxID=66882 RepID=A0ABN3F917_9ACTN
MNTGEPPLPVAIVAGLHTDARRSAVEEILRTVPGSVALHHDLSGATDRSVRRTVRDATGPLDSGEAPLTNDCACCALRADLVPELLRPAAGGGHRLAVVELWDSVEPQAMAELIAAEGAPLALTGVATADRAVLAQLTPGARHVRLGQGALGPALLGGFDVETPARPAEEVHLRPRKDPQPPGHPCDPPTAAPDSSRDQERPRDGPAALQLPLGRGGCLPPLG